MIFLIDECLHTSLMETARQVGHDAYHVVYLGMQGWKDSGFCKELRSETTLVTNNAVDFHRLYAKASLHAGLVIIVPNITPVLQRELLEPFLGLSANPIWGTVDGQISIVQYGLPPDE